MQAGLTLGSTFRAVQSFSLHTRARKQRGEAHRGAISAPGRRIVAQAGNRKNVKSTNSKSKKKRPASKSSAQTTVIMPRSRDDAVNQAALALRAFYRNSIASAPKRGVSDDVAGTGRVITAYCICPTNTAELSLSQDIAAAMLGLATGTCVFVTDGSTDGPTDTDSNVVTYEVAMTYDTDYFVCVAPKSGSISKLEGLVRELEASRRRNSYVVVMNPEWGSELGDKDLCSVIDDTAFCFFPILIKPLMMQALEGVVYKTTSSVVDEKPWKVWAGREQVGQMAVRPTTNDVESILYNAIARKNKGDGGGGSNPFAKLFGGR